jgi:hypothetical protein
MYKGNGPFFNRSTNKNRKHAGLRVDCYRARCSDYDAVLHIDCALTSAVAHAGTEIIVQIRSEDATPDEWTTLVAFVGPTGTSFHVHPSGTAAAGQKVIPVANPTAGNLNHIGKWIFLKNATIANSEKVYQTQCGADA